MVLNVCYDGTTEEEIKEIFKKDKKGEVKMTEEITLRTLDEKIDLIIDNTGEITNLLENMDIVMDKEDEIIDILNEHTTAINNILSIVDNLGSLPQSTEEASGVTSQFKTDLQAKIDEGLPYDQVKEWVISKLEELGIYSEEDVVIKIFVHKTGDMMLEVKTRPYRWWGALLQFFEDNMGEADFFETSRYTMKTISWWRLNKNMQMEEQTSDSSIIDAVNEDWEDRDDVNAHLG